MIGLIKLSLFWLMLSIDQGELYETTYIYSFEANCSDDSVLKNTWYEVVAPLEYACNQDKDFSFNMNFNATIGDSDVSIIIPEFNLKIMTLNGNEMYEGHGNISSPSQCEGDFLLSQGILLPEDDWDCYTRGVSALNLIYHFFWIHGNCQSVCKGGNGHQKLLSPIGINGQVTN